MCAEVSHQVMEPWLWRKAQGKGIPTEAAAFSNDLLICTDVDKLGSCSSRALIKGSRHTIIKQWSFQRILSRWYSRLRTEPLTMRWQWVVWQWSFNFHPLCSAGGRHPGSQDRMCLWHVSLMSWALGAMVRQYDADNLFAKPGTARGLSVSLDWVVLLFVGFGSAALMVQFCAG